MQQQSRLSANEGNAADSFDLPASGDWMPMLSANSTRPLEVGQSFAFTLDVVIPITATYGSSDTTTIVARSAFDPEVSESAQAITTAERPSPVWKVFLPLVLKNSDG